MLTALGHHNLFSAYHAKATTPTGTGNNNMKAVLMSIRAEICKTIFHRWTKRLEYRTRFNKDFKGSIFVYESGADGSHKVIGAFDAGYIVRDSADDGISEQDEKFLDTLDKKTLEQYEKIVADKNVLYAIEIKNVRRFTRPMTIDDFCKAHATQKVTRAPQSWQYVDVIGEPAPTVPVTPETQREGNDPTLDFMKKSEEEGKE